jgi:hypothetical protein
MKRKKIPHDGNISKKYHTVETFQKNTTRSKHLKKIPYGRNISKKYHTVETFQNLIEKSPKEAKSTPVRTHIIQDHLISSIGTDT